MEAVLVSAKSYAKKQQYTNEGKAADSPEMQEHENKRAKLNAILKTWGLQLLARVANTEQIFKCTCGSFSM